MLELLENTNTDEHHNNVKKVIEQIYQVQKKVIDSHQLRTTKIQNENRSRKFKKSKISKKVNYNKNMSSTQSFGQLAPSSKTKNTPSTSSGNSIDHSQSCKSSSNQETLAIKIQNAQHKPNYLLSLMKCQYDCQDLYYRTKKEEHRIEVERIEQAVVNLLRIRAAMMYDKSRTSNDMVEDMKKYINQLKDESRESRMLYQNTSEFKHANQYRDEYRGTDNAIKKLQAIYEEMKTEQKAIDKLMYKRIFQFLLPRST